MLNRKQFIPVKTANLQRKSSLTISPTIKVKPGYRKTIKQNLIGANITHYGRVSAGVYWYHIQVRRTNQVHSIVRTCIQFDELSIALNKWIPKLPERISAGKEAVYWRGCRMEMEMEKRAKELDDWLQQLFNNVTRDILVEKNMISFFAPGDERELSVVQ